MATSFRYGLAGNIRRRREGRGASPDDIAVASDISVIAIWRIEAGEQAPTVHQLARIAHALRVPIGELIPDITTGTL